MAPREEHCSEAPRLVLLVVDDEPDLAPMFRRFLKKHFAEFLEAPSAAKALELLQTRPVTHVVMDSVLADGEQGQSVAGTLRTLCPTVRFVALFSGSTSLRGVQLPGVDRVFIKPDGFDELVQTLRTCGR